MPAERNIIIWLNKNCHFSETKRYLKEINEFNFYLKNSFEHDEYRISNAHNHTKIKEYKYANGKSKSKIISLRDKKFNSYINKYILR